VDAVQLAVGLGLVLAAVGVIDGIVMMSKWRPATCTDSFGTDTVCHAHPQAGLGLAIAVFSVLLGILLVLGSMLTTEMLRRRERVDP
jgi:ABC-type sugar transport system permease subunit